MAITSVKAKTWAEILDTTEIDWEIEGWNGPFRDLVRSQSFCLVKVGDAHLRFHLRSFNCMDDKLHTFCLQSNNYIPIANACEKCANCLVAPVPFPETPYEHLLPTGVKCSGYMLLVDVLSSQKQLNFSVSARMPGMSTHEFGNHFVALKLEDEKTSVIAIENFYRTAIWTLDKENNIKNYQPATTSIADGQFKLTATVYQVDFAVLDGQRPEEERKMTRFTDTTKLPDHCVAPQANLTKNEEGVKAKSELSSANPLNKDQNNAIISNFVSECKLTAAKIVFRPRTHRYTYADYMERKHNENGNVQLEAETEKKGKPERTYVTLITKDQKSVTVEKAVLESRNSYFQKHLEQISDDKPKSISVDVNMNPLLCILHWMETGNHQLKSASCMREVCRASKVLKLVGFLVSLEKCIGSLCTEKNMHEVRDLTLEYKLAVGQMEVDRFTKQVKISEYEKVCQKKKVAMEVMW